MNELRKPEVLVVGSGAGGATTALELAQAGFDVLILEEGERFGLADYGVSAPEAMRKFYRRRGMTPIMGSTPIGYVEGCCVGGSTEINSGFWHRTPPEILLRWKAQFDLADASPDDLEPHFIELEKALAVGLHPGPWPPSTEAFARGINAMRWSMQEVPRAATGCTSRNCCASGCPSGAKQSMTQSLLPRAEAAGVRVLPGIRVKLLLRRRGRIVGVLAARKREDGVEELVRLDAEHFFVCAGPTETPALLRRSGIRYHIGANFATHPMLKIAARFPETMDSQSTVLPLLQVKEFWPDISLGGSYYSLGHLAMLFSENWPALRDRLAAHRNMAIYYVAVRGTGKGSVQPASLGDDGAVIRYELSDEDHRNLSKGLARLSTLLLEAGATEVYPCVHGLPSIRTKIESIRWLDELVPKKALSLTTVHAFSTCPIGERRERCAADSYGKVYDHENLYLNDASILPDSPGVNPQGSVMALARRNARHFIEEPRK